MIVLSIAAALLGAQFSNWNPEPEPPPPAGRPAILHGDFAARAPNGDLVPVEQGCIDRATYIGSVTTIYYGKQCGYLVLTIPGDLFATGTER